MSRLKMTNYQENLKPPTGTTYSYPSTAISSAPTSVESTSLAGKQQDQLATSAEPVPETSKPQEDAPAEGDGNIMAVLAELNASDLLL